jgi:hypothetical protein
VAFIPKLVSVAVSNINPPATYTFTNSVLYGNHLGLGYTSTSFGTLLSDGTVTVDFQYDNTVEFSCLLNLTVTDQICTKVVSYPFTYVFPVSFTETISFLPAGTGGGDCEYIAGAVRLNSLNVGDIPTNYTVKVYVDNIEKLSGYTVNWNGSNWIVSATSLGEASLGAGTHQIRIDVTQVSTGAVFSFTKVTNPCP